MHFASEASKHAKLTACEPNMRPRLLLPSLGLLLLIVLVLVWILIQKPPNEFLKDKDFEGLIFSKVKAPDVILKS